MPSDPESESIRRPESESESEQQHHDFAPLATVIIIYYDFYCHLYLYLHLYLSMKQPQIRIPQWRGNPGGVSGGSCPQLGGCGATPPNFSKIVRYFLFV